MRRRSDVNYAVITPKISSFNTADSISSLFGVYDAVHLGEGTHTASTATTILDNKSLFSDGEDLSGILKLSSTSTANDVVIMRSGATLSGVKVDCNLAARVSGGFASYTHGVRATNRSGMTITNNEIVAGEADAYGNLFAVGVFVERNLSAVADSGSSVIDNNYIDDHGYGLPFGIRIYTTITEGQSRGALGHSMLDVQVTNNRIYGTTKNVIEVVGPDTETVTLSGNVSSSPAGSAGMEVDFGGFNNIIEYNIIESVGRDGTQDKSFDAFNVRCGKYGTGNPGVRPTGNIVRGNILRDSVQVGDFYLRVQMDYGSDGTLWQDNSAVNLTKAVGATTDRIIGLVIEPELEPTSNMTLDGPDMDGVEVLVALSQNNHGFSGLTFNVTSEQESRIKSEVPSFSGETFTRG